MFPVNKSFNSTDNRGHNVSKKVSSNKMLQKVENLNRLLREPEFTSVINSDGKIAAPSSEVYKNLSIALDANNKMQPKYIYTLLIMNRYSVYSDLMSFLNIDLPFNESSYINSTVNTTSDNIEFNIDVTEIWSSLKPENKLYKFQSRDRNIKSLKINTWTHVLYEEIRNITNIPCALKFRSSQISDSGIFVSVSGICSECPCKFFGKIPTEPLEGERVSMDCLITDFDQYVNHIKKRPLQGNLRKAVGNHLVERNLLPCQHRRNEAHRLIQIVGDNSPPNLSKNDVLGKAKQEALGRLLGTQGSNAIDGIYNLKYTDYYNGIIHNIGLDPFFVYYWSKEQMLLFSKFSETFIVDATGSVVKPIVLPNKELSSHIFLFQAVIQINNKTVPVFQMLTTVKTTVAIISWFLEFQRKCQIEVKSCPVPKEFISDFDKALLGAAARVFSNSSSLRHYLEWCYEIIRGNNDVFPPCILRLDICHYTNIIARWKCYSKHQTGVRAMYLRAMCILRNQDTFFEFHEMFVAILKISLLKTGNRDSPAYEAKEFLKSKIKGIVNNDVEKIVHDADHFEALEEVNINFEDDNDISQNIFNYVNSTYNEIAEIARKESVDLDDDINGYMLPDFARRLKKLMPYFPLFSEIMRGIRKFGKINATSAPVESYFNDLKCRQFRTVGLPLRVDKFVAVHIREIEKSIKEAAAGSLRISKDGQLEKVVKDDYKQVGKNHFINLQNSLSPQNSKSFDNVDSEDLNLELDWRKKNKKTNIAEAEKVDSSSSTSSEASRRKKLKSNRSSDSDFVLREVSNFKKLQKLKQKKPKRKAARYGEVFPEFEPTLKKQGTCLPVIPNGSICPNIRVNGFTLSLSNTCAFDSVFEIVCMALANDKFYAEQTAEVDIPLFRCARLFLKDRLCAKLFRERASILRELRCTDKDISEYKMTTGETVCNIVRINSVCNVTDMALELLSGAPSYIIIYWCNICKLSKTDTFIDARIHLQIIKDEGIQHLKEALDFSSNAKKRCCDQDMTFTYHYSPHILISVEVGSSNKIPICDIPSSVEVNGDLNYKMAGFVGYQGDYNTSSVGHYVGYANVGSYWLKYDDSASAKLPERISNSSLVDPQILLFVKKEDQ